MRMNVSRLSYQWCVCVCVCTRGGGENLIPPASLMSRYESSISCVATRSYEEWLPRDSPHIAGEFVPVNSDAVIVEALLLVIQETCVDHEGDGNHFVRKTSSCWGGQRWSCGGTRCVRGSYTGI